MTSSENRTKREKAFKQKERRRSSQYFLNVNLRRKNRFKFINSGHPKKIKQNKILLSI